MFYILLPEKAKRNKFINYLSDQNITAVFHYLPLHNSIMGSKIALSDQLQCPVSEEISDHIVRLPMFYGLDFSNQTRIINSVMDFTI